MAEPVPDDGEPLRIGDLITLFDKQLGAFCCADGFNISSLMYLSGKDGQPSEKDTRCLFRIGPKLGYQQRKRYKKILSNIGVSSIDELESFMEEEDVAEDEVQELEALHCRGGPLEKEDKENQEEMERMRGQEVVYGTAIQLQHVNSDSWVTLMKGAGLQPGSTKIEVTRDGGEGSWFNVMPGYKVRKEGDKVVVTDQVMLTSTKKSTPERQLYVHTYREEGCEQDHRDAGMPPSLGEINAFETRTRFEVLRYSAFDQGGDVLCSGDIVRLLHKEEEGFLTLGQVGGYQSDSTKIHVLKHKAGTNAPTKGAFTCSNSLWRLEQMNVTSISGLLERRAENLPDPDEKGGNATWEQLYRIRHKGSGLYMAASFDSSMPTRGTGAARGPVRFYFTDLQADEAYLETLWSIKPVNPKPDNGVPIGMKEGFHLQHAATMYWIHAKTLTSPPARAHVRPPTRTPTCLHARTHACACVRARGQPACLPACGHACGRVGGRPCAHARARALTHAHPPTCHEARTLACTPTHLPTHTRTRTHPCTHTHARTHAHTHARARTHARMH